MITLALSASERDLLLEILDRDLKNSREQVEAREPLDVLESMTFQAWKERVERLRKKLTP